VSLRGVQEWILSRLGRGVLPATPLTIILAGIVGVAGGYGSVLLTLLIHWVQSWSVDPVMQHGYVDTGYHFSAWLILLFVVPSIGLAAVAWFTRRYAPEAEGHGVPEVITAIARHDGRIRPRVSLAKFLASGVCIGTGGSVGREGAIVQIAASLGSLVGQIFDLSARNVKVLVAAGAAAGISATFQAPLAGVLFACEIILGNFAVESLTPIVIASVIASVVQQHVGEHGSHAAFTQLHYVYTGAWNQLPSYIVLGLICGLMAVSFTKMVYAVEDLSLKYLPKWWWRALACGALVGLAGMLYPIAPPAVSSEGAPHASNGKHTSSPPLFGVGYSVINHALHLENVQEQDNHDDQDAIEVGETDQRITLPRDAMLAQLWWLLPLALLKPVMTSTTLAGGGSGGIFAPSLFIGATLGASFGIICNLLVPGISASPGVYAIVGMGAVVAGTTHGVLSAIIIVYEMTNNYYIILPIMAAAGLSSIVARIIDHDSIYEKKLTRRGESIARGHDAHRVENVMVRDVMVREFPTVRNTDNVTQIIRIARANAHIESLPVMKETEKGEQLVGIIRPQDLHRVLDSDISPNLVNAQDIALTSPISVSPDENLLEALRDFGARDVETLPVEAGKGNSRRLVGLLLRSDVMRRYRIEMLRHR